MLKTIRAWFKAKPKPVLPSSVFCTLSVNEADGTLFDEVVVRLVNGTNPYEVSTRSATRYTVINRVWVNIPNLGTFPIRMNGSPIVLFSGGQLVFEANQIGVNVGNV